MAHKPSEIGSQALEIAWGRLEIESMRFEIGYATSGTVRASFETAHKPSETAYKLFESENKGLETAYKVSLQLVRVKDCPTASMPPAARADSVKLKKLRPS